MSQAAGLSEGLERTLAEDAVLYSDGGGKVGAARHPLVGANRIARALIALARTQRRRGGFEYRLATVNGQPGAIRRRLDGTLLDVLSVDVDDGRIRTLRNPDKLAHV